ncbi:MAG: adenine phosphoribosyltransferase [Candidatus Altiarchaeota archaeon]
MDLKSKIRNVPDFPKEGINFFDITTLLQDGDAFRQSVKEMAEIYRGEKLDYIASAEARGFIFGAPLAIELGVGFVPVRKPGKLPSDTLYYEYELEYGKDALEIHKDPIKKGDRVLLVDDLLATGGTIEAAAKMVEQLGGVVAGMCFLIELSFLNGREKLKGYEIKSLISYDSD